MSEQQDQVQEKSEEAQISLDPALDAQEQKSKSEDKKDAKKTVKIELVRDCKVNGKLLLAGSVAMVSEEDAVELCAEFDGYYAGWGEGHYEQVKIVRARRSAKK